MNILILYASRWGVTRTCAQTLANKLNVHDTVTLKSVEDLPLPDPTAFDVVVLGSAIRYGKVNKTLKRYIKQHVESLNSLSCAVFLCCGFPRNFEEYVDTQIPKLLHPSLGFHSFGGELKPDKLKGFDKFVVKRIRNSIRFQDFEESDRDHHILPEIFVENINLLEEQIRQQKNNEKSTC